VAEPELAMTAAALTETVRVDGLAAGGRGVARLDDGRVCFVPLAAPRDLLDVAIGRDHGRWAEGRIVRVLEEGRGRRDAPCPYYAACGGCALQHLDYATQLESKARIVADALARIGGWEAGTPEIVASPREWRYRNRMTFTLRRLGGGRVVAGLYEREARGRVLDVDERCLLPEEPLATAWGALRRAWGGGAARLPAGRELRLTLRRRGPEAVVLVIDGGSGRGDPEKLALAVPALAAVWHRPRGAAAALPLFVRGDAPPPEPDGLEGAHAFTQVNREAAEALEAHVLAAMAPGPGVRVVDAYAGEGAHARAAALAGAGAIAIEREAAAVARGRRLAPAVDFREGDVELRLPGALPADVLVLNPPRGGLSAEAGALLGEGGADRIVYVSCDPATLARDIARLAAAYRPVAVRCFDLFPQTAHVETVVELCATT
jgi:23S rRNA (uracil1939-C5)-methyltransferase